MNPYTYTLIMKVDENWDIYVIEQKVLWNLDLLREEANPVVARVAHGEALILLHVAKDCSRYGIKLANWFSQAPFEAPFPPETLIWYR